MCVIARPRFRATATHAFHRVLRACGPLLVTAVVGCGADPVPRGPAWVENPAASPESVSVTGAVRFVTRSEAPLLLQVDSVFPDESVRLLWYRGRATSLREYEAVVALDGYGGAMEVDRELLAARVPLGVQHDPTSIAAGTDGEVWVTDTEGDLLRVRPGWRATKVADVPFAYPAVAGDPRGGIWVFRATDPLDYRLASATDPLLVRFDAAGVPSDTVRGIRRPKDVLLTELANAGHLAVTDDALYFAPFVRDEVLGLTRGGDTLWVARRALPQERVDPRLRMIEAGGTVDFTPVNLGIAVGPDGLVYVLSMSGFTASQSRIDVLDGSTGGLLRTAHLQGSSPTVAVDSTGRLYAVDPFRVLTGVAPEDRPAFGSFTLPTLDGDTLRHTALAGKVVLVNFWASWCGPCRVEMPALVNLASSITDGDFAFVTMNEDVETRDAHRFAVELAFEYPVALGRGKLQRQFHYLGLPFTALLDREGRIVYRWTGFAGEGQIEAIRSLIRAELDRGEAASAVPVQNPAPSD